MATESKPAGKAAAKPTAKAGAKAAGKPARKPAGKRPTGENAAWGAGLEVYPEWMRGHMPAVHDAFNQVNRYVSLPMLRAGLGKYMSNPVTGYLMILRTRGRRSGEMRDAPLGYAVQGDALYCLAGFGRRTNWLQNILANPKVEVILPGRSFSGVAEEVTHEAERLAALPTLVRSMGLIAGSFGMGNVWKMQDAEIVRKCEGLPLVRVRATGLAAGPEDPGGRYWVVPVVVSAIGLVWLLRRGRRRG